MHTYRKIDGKWTVGYWHDETPTVRRYWCVLQECDDAYEAVLLVSVLNGGPGDLMHIRTKGKLMEQRTTEKGVKDAVL